MIQEREPVTAIFSVENFNRGGCDNTITGALLQLPEEAASVPHNPFDLTKVWPRNGYPLTEVGVLRPQSGVSEGGGRYTWHRHRGRDGLRSTRWNN